MNWLPEEFKGLSEEEVAEMKMLLMHRERYDRFQCSRAYGALCSALHGLRLAQRFFKREKPSIAVKLGNIAGRLDELMPDYESDRRIRDNG